MSEAGVRSGAEGDRHAMAGGSRFRPELPVIVGPRDRFMSDEPVGTAELAPAHVVGGAWTDQFPIVVPGVEVFEEAAKRAVAMAQQPKLLGHLGQVSG